MSHRVLIALSLVVVTELHAQARPDTAEYKDPGTAVLLELLVPGGGHFYTGESKKGAFMLGGSIAAVTAGFVGTIASREPCERETQFAAFDRCVKDGHLNWAPLAIGSAVAIGIRLYGLIDADNAARRANARRLGATTMLPVRALVAAQPGGGAHVGVELSLGH